MDDLKIGGFFFPLRVRLMFGTGIEDFAFKAI